MAESWNSARSLTGTNPVFRDLAPFVSDWLSVCIHNKNGFRNNQVGDLKTSYVNQELAVNREISINFVCISPPRCVLQQDKGQ